MLASPGHFYLLALDLPPIVADHLGASIAVAVVLIGLVGFGFRDLIRFRLRRTWAIASVCFAESIRRRVLWITPLAILGVVVVAQLQKPFDEQDAIRQITKFCIFATGLVVVISVIILACTNLPREIESRVIYTVVTKPITRLEIVLGKILGFSCVSAAILIIMGVFSFGYLHLRARLFEQDIAERLRIGAVESIARPTLEHYASQGLLNAKSLATANSMQMFARDPQPNQPRKYFNADNMVLIPFLLPTNMTALDDPTGKAVGMTIRLRVGYDPATLPKPAAKAGEVKGPIPLLASTQPAPAPPQINVQVFDSNQTTALASEVNGGKPIAVNSPDGTSFEIPVTSAAVSTLTKFPFIYIGVLPATGNVQFWVDQSPAELVVPVADQTTPLVLHPANPNDPTSPGKVVFLGRQGTYGQQQLKGTENGNAPAALYEFSGVRGIADGGAPVPFEVRVGIERGGDEAEDVDSPTLMSLQVRNRKTGLLSPSVELSPENNRTAYGTVPADALSGGDFDVLIHCLTPGDWIGMNQQSLVIVQSESSFAFNLLKSLLVLWLLTILVISISIFCSTFLTWPIAVVLTLVILLGHWGVEQVGDAATAGLGRQFVVDFGVRDPATSEVLSSTVEHLNKLLAIASTILPDISQFSATDDIERGVTIPASTLRDAGTVVLGFGLPLAVLAYVFLKHKEVAP